MGSIAEAEVARVQQLTSIYTQLGDLLKSEEPKKLPAIESNIQLPKDALAEYDAFASAYLAKVAEFEKNIQTLEKNQAEARASLVSGKASKATLIQFDKKAKEEVDAVTAVQATLLSGLDEQMGMKNQTFIAFAEQVANMGILELKAHLDEAERLLAEAQVADGGGVDNAKIIDSQAKIKALQGQILSLSTKKPDEKKEEADPLKGTKNAKKIVTEMGGELQNIVEACEGVDAEFTSIMGASAKVCKSVSNVLMTIVTMSATSHGAIAGTTVASAVGTEVTATAATKAMKKVEQASMILAIISAAIQIITAIFKVFQNVWGKDQQVEKQIKDKQKSIDALAVSYEELEEQIDQTYSKDSAALIKQQDENSLKQKALIEEQKNLENDKKKTDKSKIQDYDKALKEIDKQLAENKKRALDAILGEDLKASIENFASAYADAWAKGGDRSVAAKDTVRQMMRQMVTESIKAAVESSGAMVKIRETLVQFYEDGVLDAMEQKSIYDMAEEMQKELDQKFKWAEPLMKEEEADSTREASKRGIATASQASVDENNGLLTSMQKHTSEINTHVDSLLRNSGVMLADLAGIRHNTASLHAISEDIRAMKTSISDITLRGINIRS